MDGGASTELRHNIGGPYMPRAWLAVLQPDRADIGGPNFQNITPYNMKYLYSFFGIIFQFYFTFFGLKRPGTSARTVVPLTMPLVFTH